MVSIGGFLPSTSGFRFPNAFPHVPVRWIGIAGAVRVPFGDASNGLCGGMAFAARDYFEAGRHPPEDRDAPGEGPLFEFLVDRLFASFGLPFGPARYLELMNPWLPDVESFWSRVGLQPHGRNWRTVNLEWPRVRADIDAGHPSPIGLVRVKSTNLFDLKQNHQVLVYGYDLVGTSVVLRIYDPNLPGRDDATLTFDQGSPTTRARIDASPAGPPTFSLFKVAYQPAAPP